MSSFKRFRKQIRRVFGCVVFMGIGLFLLSRISFMLRPDESGNYRTMFPGFYAEEKGSLDVVTLGSSAVFRYVNNPWLWRTQKITSYNIAVGTMPLEPMTYILEEVRKTQSPQVFLIETRSYLTYAKKNKSWKVFLHRITDGMDYSWNRTKLILDCVQDRSELLEFLFPIVAYHDEWENLDIDRWYNMDNRRKRKQKGWWNRLLVKEQEELPFFSDTKERSLNSTSEKELRKLLEYCTRENLQVVFFRSPYIQSEKEAGQAKTLGRIIESYGYEFWDLNQHLDEIGLDLKTDFYNSSHTNPLGARKVTTYLAEAFLKRYVKVRTYPEKVAAEWDDAAQREEEEVNGFQEDLTAQESTQEDENG